MSIISFFSLFFGFLVPIKNGDLLRRPPPTQPPLKNTVLPAALKLPYSPTKQDLADAITGTRRHGFEAPIQGTQPSGTVVAAAIGVVAAVNKPPFFFPPCRAFQPTRPSVYKFQLHSYS